MKPQVLQNARFTPDTEARLAAEFDIHPLWAESDPAAFLAQRGGDFVAVATTGGVGVDAALIDALPGLKLIASRGVGVDKLDLDAARRRGVAVSNTPGVLNDCVADLAFGALLAVSRRLCLADRFVRRGDWQRGRFPLSTRVSGKRLGIVGLGRIGRTVALRASGFNMEIRYHDVKALADVAFGYEAALVDLARWADFLVITAAGGPASQHLVSAEVIAALGEQGYLINVSRGSLVDQRALVDALVGGRLGGAALDVYEDEPNVPPELLALDNVVLLPHIASSTTDTFAAMEDLVLSNMQQFFSKGTLLTPA